MLPHMHHTCDSEQSGVGVDTSLRMRRGLLLAVYIVGYLRMGRSGCRGKEKETSGFLGVMQLLKIRRA